MGIRQEHGKVLKLQVVQALYGMIPHEDRPQYEASFESACRKIVGKGWEDMGLSMESAEGLGHYLRGVHSASGTPIHFNQRKVIRGLALRMLALESRAESFAPCSLAAAIMENSMESSTRALLARYGLDGLSLEAEEQPSAWKNLGKMIAGLFKGKGKKDEPFDYRKVDWQTVHKIADHIKNDASLVHHMQQEPVEGKISGDGIVRNLSWGNEFDEKDPVGFVKKKFAEWEKFHQAHEAAIDKLSKAVMQDEATTRKAVMAVRDDEDAIDDILDKACKKLLAIESPAKVGQRLKPTFPGGQVMTYESPSDHNRYGIMDVAGVKNWTGPKEIRALTGDEARALLTWLRDKVDGMKQYTTIYEKCRWSDHSDGDEFWDVIEDSTYDYKYASLVYSQSIESGLMEGVPSIADILADLAKGILTWVDHSFPNR